MWRLLIGLAFCVLALSAHAGKRIESCEEGDIVPGKGWVYTKVPCPVDPDEVAKEKACGKDYGALRIGITLKRFEQCNEALAYETTTVSKAGKVDVYRSTFYWVQVQGGKVVGYTRRTF